MAATNSSYLPPEIVEEILALLPIDSIQRFRFLSKSWFSLLAIKFELPKKLLRCRREGDQFLFDAVVLPEYSGDVKDTVYTGPELQGGIRSYAFVGSCNGLVCLQRKKQFFYAKCTKELEMLVLNPVTGICRKLPERRHYYPYVYGFGYDSASDAPPSPPDFLSGIGHHHHAHPLLMLFHLSLSRPLINYKLNIPLRL
ncbi:hypothetical protein Tsubulata_045125 [Turnera subulata]|uniref:F-box domain-containing protein n=1 Tax=Turnera subulata TaxID=218843 RepID=A0A9Q0G5J8_9ROSI|nr:hypothetical protein Tsubulata_045125 [Turnera subulata]